MLFSVVILSFNSKRTIDKCLDNLIDALSRFDQQSEIFIIDNGSNDGSVKTINEYVARYPDIIKPFMYSHNTGTTFSRNKGLSASSGEYVLVLDSDAYMTYDALAEMKRYLDTHREVGLVCPRLSYADGRFQLSTDTFPTITRKVQRFFALDSIQQCTDESQLSSGAVDYAISACWLVRRDAVDAVGGFDEGIFYAPEDVDFCIQVWLKGFECHYVVEQSIVHDAQELSRGFKFNKFHFEHVKGLFYLFRKYGYFFTTKPIIKKIKLVKGSK